jgi:Type I phosphodiesterase / nucleotide pyrophosphatase
LEIRDLHNSVKRLPLGFRLNASQSEKPQLGQFVAAKAGTGLEFLPREVSMVRLWTFLAAATLLCTEPAASAAPPKPKLLLVIVVDQFRYDYLIRFRDGYTGGIDTLLKNGAVFADARYPQYPTVTATGHSTILTGATPSVSGIVNNSWFERAPSIETKAACPLASPPVFEKAAGNKNIESITDESTCLVGGAADRHGASPRRLLVSSVSDEIKMAGRGSKAIGISFKDRGAILTAGRMADAAYWFAGGKFVTSDYYMTALPAWAEAFNKENRAAKYMSMDWLPVEGQPSSLPFCSMAGTRPADEKQIHGLRACGGVDKTPFANEILEEFAEKAVESEALGTNGGTDVLTVSFSANDLIGHAVGPYEPEIRDISIRTDRVIGKLFAFLEARLGPGAVLTLFTADHGVAPVPGTFKRPGTRTDPDIPGKMIDPDDVRRSVNADLSARFGTAEWVLPACSHMLYLNYETDTAKKADGAEIRRAAAEAAAKIRGIARAVTRDDLLRGFEQADRAGQALALGFYGPRSGDVILLPEPYWMFGGKSPGCFAGATTHLTPYSYDAHVPLIVMGRGIKAGTYYSPVVINDAAPTLAAILEVEAPSGSSGRILNEIFE